MTPKGILHQNRDLSC